jgi:hypothetical protein
MLAGAVQKSNATKRIKLIIPITHYLNNSSQDPLSALGVYAVSAAY